MQVSSKKGCKKINIFDLNIYQLLMSIIIITALVVIFIIPLSNTNKIITLAGLVYLFIACIFLNDNTDISIEILGIEVEESTSICKCYLNSIIDTLQEANLCMNTIIRLDNYSNLDIKEYLTKLKAIYIYLNKVNPPKQYQDYHENIVLQLELFIKKYN